MKVLISGAGIAGTCLAYWLLERGFQPTLVERAPRRRTGGYLVDFWGAGLDVASSQLRATRLYDCGPLGVETEPRSERVLQVGWHLRCSKEYHVS